MRIWYGIFDWNIQYIKLLDLIWYLGVSENGYAPKVAILSDDDKAVDLGIPIFRQALELVMDRNWICTTIDHVCNQSSVKHTMAIFRIYGCGPHQKNHIDMVLSDKVCIECAGVWPWMSSKAAPTTRTTGDVLITTPGAVFSSCHWRHHYTYKSWYIYIGIMYIYRYYIYI